MFWIEWCDGSTSYIYDLLKRRGQTTEGVSTNGLIFDQNGYRGDDDPLKNQWHLRTISLTPVAGKHFSYMTFGGGSGAGNESGAYSVYFTDMVIIGANGEVHPLYTGQPSASVNYVGAANMTGLAESIGQNITNGESHFYLSDDLNSVRMVLGGWPLSESTYTPFGQEVNATISGYNNTYKFTGMEQDAETDLNHTWFRQYAATQGRWMSPDPYNGSYDIANPQSFNRYGYVNNSPTTEFDPSGLHEASCYNIIHCNPSLFWGGGVPGGFGFDEFSMLFFSWGTEGASPFFDGSLGGMFTIGGPGEAGINLMAFTVSSMFYQYTPTNGTTAGQSNGNLPRPTVIKATLPGTNYCGPGGSGTPTNRTDAACAAHDLCYQNAGVDWQNNFWRPTTPQQQSAMQACDANLCTTLNNNYSPTSAEAGQATLVETYFGCSGGYGLR